MDSRNIITADEAIIYLDEYNQTHFENSVEGRETMREHLSIMGMEDEICAILSAWGDAPTVSEEPSFEELKQDKINELTSSFNSCVTGAFTTSQGYLMQFDTSDSIKMQGAITLMEAVGSTVGYITQANDVTVYDVPIETMKQVLVEMLSAYAQCHARKQELRALINNAQTKEELDEIVISWPV